MEIAICGGTGFIGKSLTQYFLNKGYYVYILTRSERTSSEKNLHYVKWLSDSSDPVAKLEGIDVVINLAGKSINDRWTKIAKKEIGESRVKSTRAIYSIIKKLQTKPSVFINASAIGIYGTSLEETFTEQSKEKGTDFLATTVLEWEKEVAKIEDLQIRTIYARFGIVLGKEGALPKMVLPYKLFAGGNLGSGKQWVSWIHINDLVRLIDFTIHTPDISGPVNVTAPNPVRMNEFDKSIANILKKPHWLPVPTIALKTLLGEMSILVLEGQKVLPEKGMKFHFHFLYPSLDEALSSIFS